MNELPLEAKVDHLRRPETYRERPTHIDPIETHMSWVFLTDRSAYKLKKPIRYHRLDFTTLGQRRFYCEEEVRLNRRLAGKIYRGTVMLTHEDGVVLALGGAGQPVDWLVHMRRLPETCMLDAIIAKRTVEEEEVRAVAHRLAGFFANAHRVSISTSDLCERLAEGIRMDRHELSRPEFDLSRERVEAIASTQLAFLEKHAVLYLGLFHRRFPKLFLGQRRTISHTDHCGGLVWDEGIVRDRAMA